MKLNINQSELNNALTVVAKGSSNRSTLTILAGVYLKAEESKLILQTTNLELSIKMEVPALVEEPGEAVVPAKLIQDIVKNLPDMAVRIETSDDTSLSILCDTTSFSLRALNPLDFPAFPEIQTDQEALFPFKTFASMVKQTAKVVSHDETHAILTGVLITQENNTLKMVATDSYRLAVAEAELNSASESGFEAVISGSFLQTIASLVPSDEFISLALNENQIIITYNNTTFINRRLEGAFPNYKQLIGNEYSTKVVLPTHHVIDAVRRVSLLSTKVSPIQLFVDTDANTVTFASHSQDVGNAQETLSGTIEGESVDIAFNYNFVLDGLNSITSDTVEINFFGAMKPGILRSTNEESFLYLIMPVRV